FVVVSAADVLQDRVAPGVLAGRIVFVGATALGIGEFVATPLDPRFPGVGVHATAVDNIARGDALSRPAPILAVELVLTVAGGDGAPPGLAGLRRDAARPRRWGHRSLAGRRVVASAARGVRLAALSVDRAGDQRAGVDRTDGDRRAAARPSGRRAARTGRAAR